MKYYLLHNSYHPSSKFHKNTFVSFAFKILLFFSVFFSNTIHFLLFFLSLSEAHISPRYIYLTSQQVSAIFEPTPTSIQDVGHQGKTSTQSPVLQHLLLPFSNSPRNHCAMRPTLKKPHHYVLTVAR